MKRIAIAAAIAAIVFQLFISRVLALENVNSRLQTVGSPTQVFNPTPVAGGPAGTLTVTSTFKNISNVSLSGISYTVVVLTGGNLLLNRTTGSGGPGSTLTVPLAGNYSDGVLTPNETFSVTFVIGLATRNPFQFQVDAFANVNNAPIADAGPNKNVLTGALASLDGSASFDPDGNVITFQWTLKTKPATSTATLTNPTFPDPEFTPDVAGDYIFQLIVNDGALSSTAVSTTVSAFTGNAPPNSNAGRDEEALVGAPTTLDGSESNDPNGTALTYTWTFVSKPAGSPLTNASILFANTANPQFTPDRAGTFVLNLRVSDGTLFDDDTINVVAKTPNVTPFADAGPDQFKSPGQTVTLDGTGSFDPDSGPAALTYAWSLIAKPAGSALTTASLSGASTANPTFTPDVNGQYLLRLKVSDSQKDNSDNVLVTVAPNVAPVVNTATFSLAENSANGTVVGTVTFTDANPGQGHTFAITAGNTNLAFAINSTSGQITVANSSALNFETTPTFNLTVEVTDDGTPPLAGNNTITVNLTNVNEAPVVNAATFSVTENSPNGTVVGTVTFTDPDAGQTGTFSITAGNTGNAFQINAGTGQITVQTSSAVTNGATFSLTVQVTDNGTPALSGSNTITINVTPANHAPTITDTKPAAVTMSEDGSPTPFSLTLHATDADGNTITWSISSPATNGTATASGTGTSKAIGYTPNANFSGADSFTVQVSDGNGGTDTIIVNVTINAVNDAPTITDTKPAAVIMDEDGSPTAFSLTLHATDAEGDTITWSISSPASHGTATASGTGTSKAIGYTPAANYNGSDSFTVQVSDGNGGTDTIIVNVTIAAVNDAPTITDTKPAAVTMSEDGSPTAFSLTLHASDVDGDTLTWSISSAATNGAATASGTGTSKAIGYTPNANYNGSDSFTVQVSDGVVTDTIIVNVTINAVNDPPVANGFTNLPAQAGIPITYPAGKLGGSDPVEGTAVTINTTPDSLCSGCLLTINTNGGFTFTPPPSAAGTTVSFTYHVTDSGTPGTADSAPATVSFNVAGPAIYFAKSAAVGTGNCTLGNECTVATAVTNIGASTSANIFISDANTQSPGNITLNSGGSIIGQGLTGFASFDAFFSIGAPAEGTLATRPLINQSRPTISGASITANTNSGLRGFNLTPTGNGLIASSKTGLTVSDMNITSSSNSGAQFAVNFTSSSGTFTFGNVTVSGANAGSGVNFASTTSSSTVTFNNITTASGAAFAASSTGATDFTFNDVTSTTGKAVNVNTATGDFLFHAINNNGGTTGITVSSATGTFTVNGTGTTAGSGGTVQNNTSRGGEFISSNNITLKNMNFTGNGTAGIGALALNCADALNQSTAGLPAGCQSNIHLQSTTTVVLNNVKANQSKAIGILGNGVNGLTLTNVEARQNGDEILEDGVQLVNLAGTVNVTGSTFKDNASRSFEVQNNTGSPTINISTSFFGNTNFPTAAGTAPSPSNSTAASTVLLATNGNNGAFITSVVTDSTFDRIYSDAFFVDMGNGNNRQNVTFGQAGHGNTITNASLGINIVGVNDPPAGTKGLIASIVGNTLNNDETLMDTFSTTNINFRRGGGANAATGDWDVTIDDNDIGLPGNAKSGCETVLCFGISADDQGSPSGTFTVIIQNNTIYNVGGGIQVGSANAGAHTVRATIINNTVQEPDTAPQGGSGASEGNGIVVFSGTAATATTFAKIEDNNVDGGWDSVGNQDGIRIRHAGAAGSSFFLCNFVLASSAANVTTHLINENPLSSAPAGFDIAGAAIGAGLTVQNGCP